VQSTAADPLLGQVLEGRYRILSRLAAGGMSTVYAGVDERLDREVAIKVMNSSLSADPAFVDRVAREARSAAKLSHLNAVSVYDQGSDAGKVFLIMELVRGRTLRELIRERGKLSPAEAVSIMEPVLAALSAAHRAGLVHRDIKPENILLSDDGVVKVADFGLARAVETNAANTRTGLMMGTVAYSSPEQFRGHRVDMRTDVYSSGIVLFELLTGAPPYQGPDAMAVAYQHVHSDVPPPSAIQAGIAPPLDRLVTRATSRDPNRRPPDAGTFLAELHDVRQALHLPVLPIPRRQRPGRPAVPPPSRPSARQVTARTTPVVADPRPVVAEPNGVHPTTVAPSAPPPAAPPNPPIEPDGRRPLGRDHKRPRWVRTLIGAIVLLLLCAAIIVGSWWWASGRYSSIKDVRSQTVAQAEQAIKKQGFKAVVDDPQPSDTVPSGKVISTTPAGGSRLARGRTVHIVPSGGPTFYGVPVLANHTKSQAQAALAQMQSGGVTVTYDQTTNDTVPNGSVIKTTPGPGARVKRGDSLTVTVSTGLPILPVPDVRGKSQDDATKMLTADGFKVTAQQVFSDDIDKGTVISQNPAGNSQQRKFTTITLTVSKGPDLVEIPTFDKYARVNDVRPALEGLGFNVEVDPVFGGDPDNGIVLGIDPPSGTMAKRGSTVTLSVF
jgi:serine/threonine-protein kinase